MKVFKFVESLLNIDITNHYVRIVGSILVTLSALILFADKVITLELDFNYGFGDTATLIWMISQTLCPFVLILGTLLKPYKTTYLLLVYVLSIQMYWIFDGSARFDDYLLQTYSIGTVIIVCVITYLISKVKLIQDKYLIETNKRVDEADELIKMITDLKLKEA